MVPLIEPLFFPFASSRITPTHFPTAKYIIVDYCKKSDLFFAKKQQKRLNVFLYSPANVVTPT